MAITLYLPVLAILDRPCHGIRAGDLYQGVLRPNPRYRMQFWFLARNCSYPLCCGVPAPNTVRLMGECGGHFDGEFNLLQPPQVQTLGGASSQLKAHIAANVAQVQAALMVPSQFLSPPFDQSRIDKCECGAFRTVGAPRGSRMHSDWCGWSGER